MKSIKKQLFMAILGVVFGFGLVIAAVMLSQLVIQKNRIQEQGQREAGILSKETGGTLSRMNEQTAKDFSSSCTKYFNMRFAGIRRHVDAIRKNLSALYREGGYYGAVDEKAGLVKGVSAMDVSKEFGAVSPIRKFIKYLPEYNPKDTRRLDLYVVSESGMCLDGTETALGNNYADLRKEAWYKETKKNGKTYWSGIFKGKVTGKIKVICSMPVYGRGGEFKGCAAGDMTVDAFQEMIEEFHEEQIISVIFFDKSGELMYATNDYQNTKQAKEYLGKKEVVSMGDEVYSYASLEETGWTICLVLNQETARQTTQKLQADVEGNAEEVTGIVQDSIQRIITIFVICMAAGAVLVVVVTNFLAAGFVRPIRQLMLQVKAVGAGDLDQVAAVRSDNEIGQLAGAFQRMTVELKDYMGNLQNMAANQERMAAELNVAKQIQMNMLPDKFPAFPDRHEFDIYAVVKPAAAGGGSFYDFFMVDKRYFCLAIGDVEGMGVPATLFAVITKTHIKNYAQLGYQPDRILAETNNQLSYRNEAGLTVSVFVGIVDLQTGDFQYSNAGQMAPLWKHSGKDFAFLEAKNCFALANMENVPYWKQAVRLAQGDMLFLYTRGVAEMADAKGNEYTQEYLYEYLNTIVKHKYRFQDIADSVQGDLQRFSAGMEQKKDSTMLLFRYFGK